MFRAARQRALSSLAALLAMRRAERKNTEMNTESRQMVLLAVALAASNGVYLVLMAALAGNRAVAQTPPPHFAPIGGGLVLCALTASVALGSRLQPDLPKADFQRNLVFSLAAAEVSAVLGLVWFFLGGTMPWAAACVIGAAVVDGLFHVPRAMAWRGDRA